MRFFVTGGAGFIGSNLVDTLLAQGHTVIAYDNLSTGRARFLQDAQKSPRFTFILGDMLDITRLRECIRGTDFVFHLAANADVRFGLEQPKRDLEQNTLATFNLLEAMRHHGIRRIAFSSTGSVYGEAETFPTHENVSFPIQTSLYGASKLAGEGLIEAYCEGYGFQGYIFRFVSILGGRYSHGHVFDFYKSLQTNPQELMVLGNGRQRKSYLSVRDCIQAMCLAVEKATSKINIFNLGTDEYCEVNDSIRWITDWLGLRPKLNYSGGERGWIGDSPFIFLDCSRIRELGWAPTASIQDSVLETLEYLRSNLWLFESRSEGLACQADGLPW